MHQFLDRFDPTSAIATKGPAATKALHHVFVIVMEIVRSELDSCGNRTDASADIVLLFSGAP